MIDVAISRGAGEEGGGKTNPPVAEEGKGKEVGEGMHVEELSLERERETGALSGGKFDKYS